MEIVVSAFEQWQPPAEPFDVVVAATAFRWLDPGTWVPTAADVLRPGGVLATIATFHVAGGSEAFFRGSQACYERWDPATIPGQRLLPTDDIALDNDELDRSGRFGPATFHRLAGLRTRQRTSWPPASSRGTSRLPK